MNFLNTWAGVVGMYAFAAALFAYSFWSHAAREKAIDQGGGLSVTRLGRGMIMAGLIIGGSGPFFGELPPAAPLGDIVAVTVLGLAIGSYAAGRTAAKWDAALRENQGLSPLVARWWTSRWAILGIMVALLLFSLLCPSASDLVAGALGNFGAVSGYLLSALFFAYGMLITLWARRKERRYGKPIKLPLIRR